MTQDDSTLVRISKDTKRQLEELGLLWRTLWYKGRMDVPPPNYRDQISIDRIIQELLIRDKAHRMRARKNSRSESADAGPGVNNDPQGS